MIKLALLSALAALLVVGCGTTSATLSKISVGMTKDEVVKIMGPPHVVAAKGDQEYLSYNLDVENLGGKREYFVKLVNGRVDSFGQKGDFDTTIGQKKREEITIKHE